LEQIVVNLLSNASKFTRSGGEILLDLTLESAGQDDKQVAVLHVPDNGIGIDAEMLSRIFDFFMHGDRATNRSRSGIGLGLTRASRLVEMHGGQIEASSAGKDRGSEFLVRLPLIKPPAPEPRPFVAEYQADAQARPASRRILVIDDHVDNAE